MDEQIQKKSISLLECKEEKVYKYESCIAKYSNKSLFMRQFLIKIYFTVSTILMAPLLILYFLTPEKSIIISDVKRWSRMVRLKSNSDLLNLLQLLSKNMVFRNLYYYRIKNGNLLAEILAQFYKIFYKELRTLYIYCNNCGPGLFIQHGFCTIISADSIGENCWINQQVTIGYANDNINRPIIGNNVRIAAGAKVLGGVTIGNNVTVGANAVVVKDVPDNCLVVGVPAYIVKRNGVRVKELL